MNASTPERLALKLRASLNMIGDGDWTPQDMAASRLCDAVLGLRVEEPAGEPDAPAVSVPASSRQTAVASGRNSTPDMSWGGGEGNEPHDGATASSSSSERVAQSANADVPETLAACEEAEAWRERVAGLRAALDQAYRRVGEADAQRMVALRKNDERVEELEEALARVAGLEAREASLRNALEDIVRNESQPSGAGYRIAQLLAALADSGEAGS